MKEQAYHPRSSRPSCPCWRKGLRQQEQQREQAPHRANQQHPLEQHRGQAIPQVWVGHPEGLEGGIPELPGGNPGEGIPGEGDSPGEGIRGAAAEADSRGKHQQVGHQVREDHAACRIEEGNLVPQGELRGIQGEEDNRMLQQDLDQGQVPRDGREEGNHGEVQLRDKRRGRRLVHEQERHEERQKDSRADRTEEENLSVEPIKC